MAEKNRTKPRTVSVKSPGASSTPGIDPNQLLYSCHKISQCMADIESSINLAQLQFKTFAYIKADERTPDLSVKCFDQLVELSNLSRSMMHLLEELNLKLSESVENSIEYQIACQQLLYFTGEWYDNLRPKLNETFDLVTESSKRHKSHKEETSVSFDDNARRDDPTSGESRSMTNALLRLRTSMSENERLIANIAGNIEYTRGTIDTIYNSLHSSRVGVKASEKNTQDAIGFIRKSTCCRVLTVGLLCILVVACIYYLLRAILN